MWYEIPIWTAGSIVVGLVMAAINDPPALTVVFLLWTAAILLLSVLTVARFARRERRGRTLWFLAYVIDLTFAIYYTNGLIFNMLQVWDAAAITNISTVPLTAHLQTVFTGIVIGTTTGPGLFVPQSDWALVVIMVYKYIETWAQAFLLVGAAEWFMSTDVSTKGRLIIPQATP